MNISPLTTLVSGVRTFFEAQNVGAEVRLGFREHTKQINQGRNGANRVVFVPGVNGKGGEIIGVKGPGGNPRPLYIWDMAITVHIWASDNTEPKNEEKQIAAAFNLLEKTTQAIHRVAFNAGKFESLDWTVSPTENIFGVEIVGTMQLRANIFDLTDEIATPTPVLTREITT